MERQSPRKQHSLAATPLRGKPGSPRTLCGTGERPSRGWGSFSVALSLTFNENKQAGMGWRCGRAAWPCAGHWLRTAASAAQALHKDGQSRGGAGSDAIPWGEAARGKKPRGGHCPRQPPGWDSAHRWGEPGGCIASRRGRRHGLHAGSGRLGWRWALQRAGLLAPPGPWHWHGGCRLVGTWDGFSLGASQNQPSLTSFFPNCSPNVADAVHPPRHPPGPWDLRVPWVTALSGDTAATPALQAWLWLAPEPRVSAHSGAAMPLYVGAPDASCSLRDLQGGDLLWAGEAIPQQAHSLGEGLTLREDLISARTPKTLSQCFSS